MSVFKWISKPSKSNPSDDSKSNKPYSILCSKTSVDFFEKASIDFKSVIECYRCPEEPAFYAFWGYKDKLQLFKQDDNTYIPHFSNISSTLPSEFNDSQFREIITIELDLVKDHVAHLTEVSWFQENNLTFEKRILKISDFVSLCLGGARKQEDLVEQWKYHSSLEQQKRGGPVVLLSQLRVGLSYHRALLFKALSFAMGIEHCYIRLDKKSEHPSAQTLVWTQGWSDWQKVDLCENPGKISPITKSATNSQHGYVPQSGSINMDFSDTSRYPYLSYGAEDQSMEYSGSGRSQPPAPSASYPQFSSTGMYPSITTTQPTFQYSTAIPVDHQIDKQIQMQSKKMEPSNSQGAFGGSDLIGLWDVVEPPQSKANNSDELEGGGPQQISTDFDSHPPAQNSNSNSHPPSQKSKKQLTKIISDNYLRTEILKIPYRELKMIKRIGQGGFGEVHLAEWLSILVAVKILYNNTEHVVDDFKQEVQTLGMLSHENVVQLRAVVEEPPNLSIIMEYVPQGSLFQQLHSQKNGRNLPLWQRMSWALDIAKGMWFLHYRNVEHRDLKTANLLLDRGNRVKITDFGLSKTRKMITIRSQPGTTAAGTGTVQYMAPEQMNMQGVLDGKKVDVYSYGVVLWELATQQIPWEEQDPFRIIGLVAYQDKRLEIPDDVDENIKKLIKWCWETNPEERPEFEQIVCELSDVVKQLQPPE